MNYVLLLQQDKICGGCWAKMVVMGYWILMINPMLLLDLILSNSKNLPQFGRLVPYVNSEYQVSNVSVFLFQRCASTVAGCMSCLPAKASSSSTLGLRGPGRDDASEWRDRALPASSLMKSSLIIFCLFAAASCP
jgi:hypothetical protein